MTTCLSLTDPTNRYYRQFGARGCNGTGSFGRWKYDSETEWKDIPCPACQRRPNTATTTPSANNAQPRPHHQEKR